MVGANAPTYPHCNVQECTLLHTKVPLPERCIVPILVQERPKRQVASLISATELATDGIPLDPRGIVHPGDEFLHFGDTLCVRHPAHRTVARVAAEPEVGHPDWFVGEGGVPFALDLA